MAAKSIVYEDGVAHFGDFGNKKIRIRRDY